FHLRDLIQHFLDTVCRSFRDHDQNEYKRNHHKGTEDLDRVDNDTGQLSRLHSLEDNALSADEHHAQHHRVNGKLHDWIVPCHDFFCFAEQIIDNLGNLMEFLILVLFSDISLYHSGSIDVFLYGIIQHIVFVKDFDKVRMRLLSNKDQ